MTEDGLKAQGEALARFADKWTVQADRSISGAVDRAHAHATVALTETLRNTPDGRKSLRKASQSRSYVAALSDLDDLTTELAGPSIASLSGMLRDAREATYRLAFKSWAGLFPEAYSIGTDVEPTQSRIADIRGLVLHGMELRREMGGKVDQSKRDLLAVLEMAARKANSGRSPDYLGGWKLRTTSAILMVARMAISDATVAIESIAGVDAVKPEFRPKNRYTPE